MGASAAQDKATVRNLEKLGATLGIEMTPDTPGESTGAPQVRGRDISKPSRCQREDLGRVGSDVDIFPIVSTQQGDHLPRRSSAHTALRRL